MQDRLLNVVGPQQNALVSMSCRPLVQNSAASNHALLDAGRFGFQKEMNALSSLKQPNAEENHNVQALLNSTQEIEDRYKIIWRWWRVWRPDVRAGWVVLGRFKVTPQFTQSPNAPCIYHPWKG